MKITANNSALEKILLLSVLAFPFLKGLFFREVLLPFYAFLIVLFVIFIILKQSIVFDIRLLVLFLLQTGISLVMVKYGINREEALYGFFITVLPVLAYLLFVNFENIDLYITVFFISGIILSLMNILIEFISNGSGETIRFAWGLPYANTLAVYLFSSSIGGLHILSSKRFSMITGILLKTALCINLTAFFFTFSRIMWVISVVLYILYLLLRKKMKITIDLISISIIALLNVLMISIIHWKMFWLIFISMFLFFLLYELLSPMISSNFDAFVQKQGQMKKWHKTAGALFAVIIFIALAIVFTFNSPELRERLLSINFNSQELLERLAYYLDAPKVIRDFSVLGTGPGGWASIQFKYQTAVYQPIYVHSSILQAALDYGLVGLTLFILQIGVFVLYIIRSLKSCSTKLLRPEITCLLIINTSILVHSILDIDLQFPLISMIFFVNMALLSVLSMQPLRVLNLKRAAKCLITGVSILLILAAIPFYISNNLYLKATKDYSEGKYQAAEAAIEKAALYNPFSSSALYMQGKSLTDMFEKNHNIVMLQSALACLEEARELDQYNPEYVSQEAYIYLLLNDTENRVAQLRKLIGLQPIMMINYEKYSDALVASAEEFVNIGYPDKAAERYREIIGIEELIKVQRMKIRPFAYKLKHIPALTLTPNLAYNIGVAWFYFGDLDKAEHYIEIAAADPGLSDKISELENK